MDVEILDDNIVETPPEETFTIVVTPGEPNPYRATAGPNSEVPVTIVDDDGKVHGRNPLHSTLQQGWGQVPFLWF